MKGFGFWTGWFVVVASMVGSGILTNSGPILAESGSYFGLMVTWFIGGMLALCGAFTLAELASGLPGRGGDYAYVREGLGPAWGFVYGWSMVVVGFAAPIALVAYTTANYFSPLLLHAFGKYLNPVHERECVLIVASVLILKFTVSHSLGHESSSRVQAGITIFNVAILILLSVLCIASPGSSFEHFWQARPIAQTSPTQWGSHIILVLYAYTGWNASAYLSGEMRDPARNLPRTLIWGCLAVTGLYLLVNLAYSATLSPELIAALSTTDQERLAEVSIGLAVGPHFAKIFSALISLGLLASLSAFIMTGPRIVHAMAHDGLFPKFAGILHGHVPLFAILFQGGLALIFLWSGSFEQVLDFTGFGLAVLGLLTVVPIFFFRRRDNFRPAFRTPFYPFTPMLFLTVSVASLILALVEKPLSSALSLLAILIAFPIYIFVRRGQPNQP